MRFSKWTGIGLAILLAGHLLTVAALAQTNPEPAAAAAPAGPTGTISGTVKDASNAAMAGASVTATNAATGDVVAAVTTDETGAYKFDSIAAGTYKLSSALNDYTPAEVSTFTLAANDSKQFDLTLTLSTTARMFRITHPFFKWSEDSWLGTVIRSHQYPFAVIEVVHLFGLTLLLGGIFLTSLRLFGWIMVDMPVPQVAKQLGWVTFSGVFIMATTGFALYASEALKCYSNTMFWYKMLFFFPGVLFHFTMYRKVTRSPNSSAAMRGLTGLLALFLWFGVAVFGRAIGYF